jgi:hypothetical protein
MSAEKKLKKIIKQYVRESLLEIFSEEKMKSIVESVISRQVSFSAPQPNFISPPRQMNEDKQALKQSLKKKLGIDDDGMWNNIYGNIDIDENPIINEQAYQDQEEGISNHILESTGILRDYSKFVEGVSSGTGQQEDDLAEKREYRTQRLRDIMK